VFAILGRVFLWVFGAWLGNRKQARDRQRRAQEAPAAWERQQQEQRQAFADLTRRNAASKMTKTD
jgi:hypothetical protein